MAVAVETPALSMDQAVRAAVWQNLLSESRINYILDKSNTYDIPEVYHVSPTRLSTSSHDSNRCLQKQPIKFNDLYAPISRIIYVDLAAL